MDIDPYKFLGVTKTFTPDQLKAAYKKLALTMHPDKEGGNPYMFNILTDCYKQLAREYNKRISDRQFNELKTESHFNVHGFSALRFFHQHNSFDII